MYCKKISVANFRNIEKCEVEFAPGVNILYGENAQGKTNLIEAIFYSSVCRSFRASNVGEMIRFGEKSAEISLDYTDAKRDNNIKIRFIGDKKKIAEKNHLRAEKMSDIVGSFRAVLFCPEHLSLIKDGPSERRNYLDIAISRISQRYIRALQRYNYFLKQRNALIKSAYHDRAAFDATVSLWSEKMAQDAAAVSKMRYEFVCRIAPIVNDCLYRMTGEREQTEMLYRGSAGLKDDEYLDTELVTEKYIELLSSSHDREIAAGATLWGVHKDDVEIKLNGKNARIFASQGQQRSLALSLKLAEGEVCREEFGDYPVFLFDDVFSELDDTRRDSLLLFDTQKQVIITTCESAIIEKISAKRLIKVENGRYFCTDQSSE